MRNEPLEEGRRWLWQAQEDLHWARHLAQEGAYHLACFLSQQVAEKALKAFLYAQGEELVIGRSVERLCAAARGPSWTATTSPPAIPTDYPAGFRRMPLMPMTRKKPCSRLNTLSRKQWRHWRVQGNRLSPRQAR